MILSQFPKYITHATTALRSLLVLAMVMLMAQTASARWLDYVPQPSTPDSLELLAPVQVSLLTCAPGAEPYQLEGHSALRIKRDGYYDLVINWGVFDFKSPHFFYRFLTGRTDYMALAEDMPSFIIEYMIRERGVTEQNLALTPAQGRRVEEMIVENLRPENATYRYNYVYDNCATRPLGVIEAALGENVQWHAPDSITSTTFRSEMRRYHRNYPWYQFGIDLALGSGIDRPVTNRQLSFAPTYLADYIAKATVTDSIGNSAPLVESQSMLVPGSPAGIAKDPTPWLLTPMAAALLLLFVTIYISARDLRRKTITRWFDSALFGMFAIMGLALTFLMFFSVHEATSPNWLYLWVNPLCLIPAVGVWIKNAQRAVYCYQFCNFALLIALLAGHSFLGQVMNPAFYPLIACDLIRCVVYIIVARSTKHQ